MGWDLDGRASRDLTAQHPAYCSYDPTIIQPERILSRQSGPLENCFRRSF